MFNAVLCLTVIIMALQLRTIILHILFFWIDLVSVLQFVQDLQSFKV